MENDDREKKEIKAEAQRCALSEKRKFWASKQQQKTTVDGETLFFFCIVTHSF
jgi:hypothetical protein